MSYLLHNLGRVRERKSQKIWPPPVGHAIESKAVERLPVFEEAKKYVVERRAELRSEWETTMDQLRTRSAKA
jgi:hypothetical protein